MFESPGSPPFGRRSPLRRSLPPSLETVPASPRGVNDDESYERRDAVLPECGKRPLAPLPIITTLEAEPEPLTVASTRTLRQLQAQVSSLAVRVAEVDSMCRSMSSADINTLEIDSHQRSRATEERRRAASLLGEDELASARRRDGIARAHEHAAAGNVDGAVRVVLSIGHARSLLRLLDKLRAALGPVETVRRLAPATAAALVDALAAVAAARLHTKHALHWLYYCAQVRRRMEGAGGGWCAPISASCSPLSNPFHQMRYSLLGPLTRALPPAPSLFAPIQLDIRAACRAACRAAFPWPGVCVSGRSWNR